MDNEVIESHKGLMKDFFTMYDLFVKESPSQKKMNLEVLFSAYMNVYIATQSDQNPTYSINLTGTDIEDLISKG